MQALAIHKVLFDIVDARFEAQLGKVRCKHAFPPPGRVGEMYELGGVVLR